MERAYGKQGFSVSALGFGAGHIGNADMDEVQAGTLLDRALDIGITLIDTAPSYGSSQERIGRHIGARRREFVLSTKVGYGIPGYADWTYDCVLAGVDAALEQLHTDYLDIVHLHSCSLATLQQGDVILALHKAREQGKLRVVAYSGENEALRWAIESGQFGGIECSVNIFDQRCLEQTIPLALERGIGVIAKRPVANAPWRFSERPHGDYCEEYWERMKAMGIESSRMDWQELALRFAVYAPGISSAIVGTASTDHLLQNKLFVEQGPLPAERFEYLRQVFRRHDDNWMGQV